MANEEGRTARSAAWGVATLLFGGGAFVTWPVAVAAGSTFPLWPVYLFGGVAAIVLYMCFATIWQWWPASRAVQGSSVDAITPVQEPSTGTSGSLPPPPVPIRLRPELDVATSRFRLGVLNRGEFGRFRVRVIDARDQDGKWPGLRSWPVPWLEDGSVTLRASRWPAGRCSTSLISTFWALGKSSKGRTRCGATTGSSPPCRSQSHSRTRPLRRGLI